MLLKSFHKLHFKKFLGKNIAISHVKLSRGTSETQLEKRESMVGTGKTTCVVGFDLPYSEKPKKQID